MDVSSPAVAGPSGPVRDMATSAPRGYGLNLSVIFYGIIPSNPLAAVLRVIHPVLVEISVMRSHCSGLAGKGIVIPACAPFVRRVIVWVLSVVAGMICAAAVG